MLRRILPTLFGANCCPVFWDKSYLELEWFDCSPVFWDKIT